MKTGGNISTSKGPTNGAPDVYVPRGTSILKGIGWQFFKRRNELKMKIKELAEAAEISATTVSKIEKGELDNVAIGTLDKIAFALGLEIRLSSNYEEEN